MAKEKAQLEEERREGGSKMARLVIRGNKKYIANLSKHLRKEHPSTKKRMRVCLLRRRKRMIRRGR